MSRNSIWLSFWNDMELALGWFDSDEEHVPFDVFTGCRRASAREGLVHQFEVVISSTFVKSQLGRGRLLRPATCQLNNWTEPLRIPWSCGSAMRSLP